MPKSGLWALGLKGIKPCQETTASHPPSHRTITHYPGMTPTLPPEISIAIFSLLPPRELPPIIRLCKTFLDDGRRLLYQSVHLRSDDLNIQSTILLLQQRRELSMNIKHVTLVTTTTTRHSGVMSSSSWIPTNLLHGWNNLRSLKMVGLPFYSLEDQETFRDILLGSCTSLSHFTYQPGANPFPGHHFGISGLQRLSWQTEQATPLDIQVISIMNASLETITHIWFTGYLSLLEPTCYYDFLNLQFPHLTSLELGSLFDTTSQERSDTAITQFIIAHPGIRHLSLGKYIIDTTSFQFDESLLTMDSLPNLVSFEGFPLNITLLVHCHVQSLLNLTTLSLSSNISDTASLDDMFDVVRGRLGCGCFPHVRNLRFEFQANLSHRMDTHSSDLVHRRFVDGFSDLCPGVINWYGTLGPMSRDNLANAFNLYDDLETINLPRLSLNLYIPIKDLAIISYFRIIAQRFPKLRQVVARRPPYTELEDDVFRLRRGADGDLDSVCMLEGGEDEWKLVIGESYE